MSFRPFLFQSLRRFVPLLEMGHVEDNLVHPRCGSSDEGMEESEDDEDDGIEESRGEDDCCRDFIITLFLEPVLSDA